MGRLSQLYFAGGCFWGLQEYFSRIPGVVQAVSGYAQSNIPFPSYQQVCSGDTNAAETVRVVFDPAQVSAAQLTEDFFKVIDPLAVNRQGPDTGTQYRSGVFYSDPGQAPELKAVFAREEAARGRRLATVLEPLRNFFPAEDYHQDYLRANPDRYCHIDFSKAPGLPVSSRPPLVPTSRDIAARLSPEEIFVTRHGGTEPPFTGRYWDQHEKGIYVDVASGEPLFASVDKFDSGTGWPSFVRPVFEDALTRKPDRSHGMQRTEVRSAIANSHLGHVFDDGPADRGGLRYCINGAALKFIPYEQMEEAGYGPFMRLFDEK